MKTNTIKKEKNPFLKREELIVEISTESAPSASEVVSALGTDESLTVVKKINTNFGKQKFVVEAVVYDDAEAKEKIEVIPQKIRKKMEEERKAAEAEAKKKAAEEAEAAKAAAEAENTEEKTEETSEEEEKTE